MSGYTIECCQVGDGSAIAHNNMPAFWSDPNWRYTYRYDISVEDLIRVNCDRYPHILLRDPDTVRHIKAVDTATGELIGYARWKLPVEESEPALSESINANTTTTTTTTPDATVPAVTDASPSTATTSPLWPEAIVPTPDAATRAAIAATYDSATQIWRSLMRSDLPTWDPDTAVDARKKELLARSPAYLILEYLAVHPRHQRRGVGAALVRHGLDVARRLQRDVFAVAFASGFALYDRLAFRRLDELVQDATALGGTDRYEIRFVEYPFAAASSA